MIIKNAEILCVGTEILIGDIINTNAAHISRRLAELGINQYYQAVVGDNPGRLSECIKGALERCDLLILSGGLGPTYDDLTKETAAEAVGRRLYLHKESLERIKKYFSELGREMSDNNVKQAMIPEGSVVFDNDNGTAPGMCIELPERGKLVMLLPGPPRELIPMFDEKAVPYLRGFCSGIFVSKNVNILGMGEASVEQRLRGHMEKALNPTVAPYCLEGEVRLRVTARAHDVAEGGKMCDEEIARLRQTEIGKYIYGVDTTLPEAVVKALAETKATVSAAESCTGGLFAKRITDIPGASEVFPGGVVSYSNEVKMKLLGVSAKTLEKHGAVSEECAREMASGVRAALGSDIGLSATGIAGPGGAVPGKPVGTVYIGISSDKLSTVRKLTLNGTRAHIRQITTNNMLGLILEWLRIQ